MPCKFHYLSVTRLALCLSPAGNCSANKETIPKHSIQLFITCQESPNTCQNGAAQHKMIHAEDSTMASVGE